MAGQCVEAKDLLGKYRNVLRPSGCGDVVDEVVATLNSELADTRDERDAALREVDRLRTIEAAAKAWAESKTVWSKGLVADAILAGRGPGK